MCLVCAGGRHGLGQVREGARVGQPGQHAGAQRRPVQVHGRRVVPLHGVAVVALHVGDRRRPFNIAILAPWPKSPDSFTIISLWSAGRRSPLWRGFGAGRHCV